MTSTFRRFGRTARLGLMCWTSAACYTYQVTAPSPVARASEPKSEVVWSLFWGLAQQYPRVQCNKEALAEVRTHTNLGFALLTVVTLGIVAPARVEWTCAKGVPAAGRFGPPHGSGP